MSVTLIQNQTEYLRRIRTIERTSESIIYLIPRWRRRLEEVAGRHGGNAAIVGGFDGRDRSKPRHLA